MVLQASLRIEHGIPAFPQVKVSRRLMVWGSVVQDFSMKGSLLCCVLGHFPFLLFPRGQGEAADGDNAQVEPAPAALIFPSPVSCSPEPRLGGLVEA